MNARNQSLISGLSGRYAIERELGHGGMATVWLARDLRYDRLVALKVLRPELASTLGPERFLREIMLAARLQHPHIVPVYDSGEIGAPDDEEPILWFTMPYIEGESLRDRLRRQRPLARVEALRIAREAARGLQYAHEHGVIHRDVKPENILLTRDGSTLVADFGIARPTTTGSAANLTGTGIVVGTPAYMSPEQATGHADLDSRTDVYSLGCVLYEMLTGAPPFEGATAHVIVVKHLTELPRLASGAAATIPAPIRAALSRALAKSPADRQASMAEFAEALGGSDATARRPRRWGRVGVGVVIAVGLAAFLTLRESRFDPAARGAAAGSAGGTVASGFARKLAQLSFGEGVEEWPAWSPDGKLLAYAAEMDGFRQLLVRPMAGGPERQLTKARRDHIQPAWSPDGQRIAFVRGSSATGKLEPSEVDGYYLEGAELWATELGSGRETKLLDNGFNPSFSPDGKRLAFDAPLAGGHRVWISDTRGRNPRQVTSDSSEAVVHTQPRWSPDGSRLVFRRIEKTKSDIAVADLASQSIALVTDDYVLDTDPTWAPDGRSIYFSSVRGGGLNLWRVPVTPAGAPGGPAEQLTTGAGEDVQATIAPDGRRLVFAVQGINSDLWRLPVSPETGRTAGKPEPVLATTRVESRGAWSPDGRRIAFNSDRAGEMNIWLRDSTGTVGQVTSGPGGDYQPVWAPDGHALVFFSARGGNTDIWRIRLRDSALTRLTDDPALDTNPFYSPDGKHIAFVSDRTGRSEVWLMNADGSSQRQLASVGCWGHFLVWSGDSRTVVFRGERDRQIEIFRVDISSGELGILPPVMSGGHMSFSPAQSLIMDVRGHKVLWAHPVDGATPYAVHQFDDQDIRIDYPVWSPDGRWLLFDRAAPRGGDLWALEGFLTSVSDK